MLVRLKGKIQPISPEDNDEQIKETLKDAKFYFEIPPEEVEYNQLEKNDLVAFHIKSVNREEKRQFWSNFIGFVQKDRNSTTMLLPTPLALGLGLNTGDLILIDLTEHIPVKTWVQQQITKP
jgi:hypothetical protein